jgi:mRNA-degrading endonuclease RelE of RelBE toxin-antitoxin system
MKIRFLDPAGLDVDEAMAYYDSRQVGLGIRFLLAVADGLERILEQPEAWEKVTRSARKYRLHRFHFGIIYEIEGDELVIAAVADLRRQQGYWKRRLKDKSPP